MKNLVLIIGLLCAADSLQAQNQTYDFVQVSGEGEMKVQPEYVLISATVFSRANQAQVAQKQNAKEMARLEKILKHDFKIDAKDLQTSFFQVSPQYDYAQNKTIYRGIAVSHTVTIKYRKTDDVGNLLDHLLAGANQEGFGVKIDNISFGSDQVRALQAQVLEQAVNDAKTRAAVLAKAGGRKLKEVRKISDSQVRMQGFEPMRAAKMSSMMAADMASTSIAPGELAITAQVQVEFELQ